MPFARVGAMPQTSSSNDGAARRGSRGRERGITMEDLKKQTAIRLAQEQQQSQAIPGPPKTAAVASDPRTRHPVVTPQTLAARRIAAAQVNNRTEAAPVHYQRLHHHNSMVHHIPNTVDVVPPGMAPAYGGPPHGYYDQPQGGKNRNRNGRPVNKSSTMPVPAQQAAPVRPTGRYHANQQSGYLTTGRSASAPTLPTNPPPSTSANTSGYNTASSNQGGQMNSTSKLPHGLTVHELKEMTKARLQAEAAEKMAAPAEIEARDTSGFESVQPTAYGQQQQQHQHQPMHHQDFDRMSQGSDVHLVSTQAPTKPISYDQGSQMGQPAQVSPLPTAFQNYSATSSSFDANSSIDNRTVPVGNRNRVDSFPDNWESASVTSHNSTVASDYLGSESAFSSGVGGFSQLDEPPGMSLGRTQSYPMGGSRPVGTDMPSRETTPTSIPSPLGSSYFESSNSLGQRQRAMTLSPRPGLSLLHEDRPGFSDEDLGIPNFSSSRHARQQLTARSRRSFSPVLQQQSFVEPPLGIGLPLNHAPGVIGGHAGSLVDNRPRTSSTVSLPAISHTAEEFALESTLSGRRSSDSVSINSRGGAPIHRENPSIGAAESFLSSSSLYGSSESLPQSSSSVFRNDFGGIPAPPGLGGPPRGGGADGGIASGSNRVRAATWVAGQMSGSDTMFGSGGGLYEYSGEDALAGDLASILKLSGAEEKPDNGRPSMFNDISGFL